MRILLITAAVVVLAGCESGPSGRWVQQGRTDAQTAEDLDHCEKVTMQESDGQRSVGPFKEAGVKQNCMERMGYRYVKYVSQPK
jgi:hypothetical protein